MNVVAIISEYNPFHSGHKYHISKIREEFGEDSAIVAIMSGNFTQRAEVAVIDKFIHLIGVKLICVVQPLGIPSLPVTSHVAFTFLIKVPVLDTSSTQLRVYVELGVVVNNALI